MKILKIRIENINSLKGVHEIDFTTEPLESAGLFAISGSTGSGKTSILDAITIALYNKVPRIPNNISSNFIQESGIILTRGTKQSSAEVTYECTKGRYISKWQVHRAQSGKVQPYKMEIAEANSGDLLDLNTGKVPDKNSEHIGLNYEQFVRAIILAQGQFSAFLKAKEDQRGKLLEQITGGDIYRKLGIKAFEMYRQHGEELDRAKSQRNEFKSMLLESNEMETLIKDLKKLDAELLKLEKKREAAKLAIQLKNDLEKALILQGTLKEKVKEYEEELKLFREGEGERFEMHLKLIPVQESLQKWNRAIESGSDLKKVISELSEKVSGLEREKEELLKKIKILTKNNESEPMTALSDFQEKVLGFDSELTAVSTLLESKYTDLESLARNNSLEFHRTEIERFQSELTRQIETNGKEKELLGKNIERGAHDDPKAALAGLRELQAVAGNTQILQNELIGLLEKSKEYEIELGDLKKEMGRIPVQIKQQQEKVRIATLEFDKLKFEMENSKLRASLEEQRKNLKPGEQCPLCGSKEHPLFREDEIKEDKLAIHLAQTEKDLEQIKASLVKLATINDGNLQRSTKLKETKSLIENKISNKEKEITQLLQKLPEGLRKKEIPEVRSHIEQEIKNIERFIELTAIQVELLKVPEVLKGVREIDEKLGKIRSARKALYEGENIQRESDQLRRGWSETGSELKTNSERINQSRTRLKEIQKQITELEKTIEPQVKALSYESLEAATGDLLQPDTYEMLRQKKQDILDHINQYTTAEKINNTQITELRKKEPEEAIDKLHEQKEQFESEYREKKEIRDNKYADKKKQDDYTAKIAQLDKEIQSLKEKGLKWVLLKDIIGDAAGKRFSTFAQRLTLYKLILLANKRLTTLNDRYLLDIPKEEEDDSLSIIDTHMGDQRRSVKSLSGGETFLISLSMALALSDLAARNIRINSLFIDEGFGSLDKLTLDQTIDTLEKLQYDTGKSIGVISHVEAMQERITTQIEVKKNGQGYSSISIV